ncbi:hypothetical protein MtrunA17_Chr4g0072311 [Medicago truncatula]|uniref:Uncharacterized protein n=1 Tax=Medicago truncatula TaxID=3880 RepID=A0A396ILJ4_MEDTR|nr:hypothetical protein MtrunA17_Chr4g0072311 [Medicago truncatula]
MTPSPLRRSRADMTSLSKETPSCFAIVPQKTPPSNSLKHQ